MLKTHLLHNDTHLGDVMRLAFLENNISIDLPSTAGILQRNIQRHLQSRREQQLHQQEQQHQQQRQQQQQQQQQHQHQQSHHAQQHQHRKQQQQQLQLQLQQHQEQRRQQHLLQMQLQQQQQQQHQQQQRQRQQQQQQLQISQSNQQQQQSWAMLLQHHQQEDLLLQEEEEEEEEYIMNEPGDEGTGLGDGEMDGDGVEENADEEEEYDPTTDPDYEMCDNKIFATATPTSSSQRTSSLSGTVETNAMNGNRQPKLIAISKQQQAASASGFLCDEPGCGKSFPSLRKLRHHKVVHSDEYPFVCKFKGCTKKFKRKFGIDLHSTTHFELDPHMYSKTANNSSLPFFGRRMQYSMCKPCKQKFKTVHEYQYHMLKHGKEPFKCPVKGCGQTFGIWKSFQKHRASHYFNYYCKMDPRCHHSTSNLQLLKLHIYCCHFHRILPENATEMNEGNNESQGVDDQDDLDEELSPKMEPDSDPEMEPEMEPEEEPEPEPQPPPPPPPPPKPSESKTTPRSDSRLRKNPPRSSVLRQRDYL